MSQAIPTIQYYLSKNDSFTFVCPTGHSKDFCNGYTDGYGDEVNDILG
jgi:hypothetical protein